MTAVPSASSPGAARFLERALLFTFVAHGLGMVGMVLFLIPGMPGGGVTDNAARVAYVAAHPWLWRLGWFPWQLTALSDVLLAVALIRTAWIPRLPAYVTLLLTLFAILPDQIGQALWITQGIRLAQEAHRTGNLAAYLQFEQATFTAVSAWAATLYTVGALGWTWCFAAAGTWNRRLTWLSVVVWGIFLVASVGPLLPPPLRVAPAVVAAGNAVGFLLMEFWFLDVLEQVLRRSRPDAAQGRYYAWRYPRAGLLGNAFTALFSSRLLPHLFEYAPPVRMVSDIRDVIYINYLVEADRLQTLVPPGLELQQLGPEGRYALFTFLTYQHGHIRPGPLSALKAPFPSPIQSNWRIHVTDPRTGIQGIHFISTAMDQLLTSMMGRLAMEAMPMHLLAQAELRAESGGRYALRLEPGTGSGPDVEADLQTTEERTLPLPWSQCFKDYTDFLAYCVPQNRAMSWQSWYGQITRQEIRLDIPLEDCEPLTGTVRSRLAQEIAGDAEPLCFHVPAVYFRFDGQERDLRL